MPGYANSIDIRRVGRDPVERDPVERDPVERDPVESTRPCVVQPCLWMLLGLLILLPVRADEFQITNAATRLEGGVYLLDADIRYRLSDTVREALASSVPLTFVLRMQVRRERRWLWDITVATLEQRFRLQYHALAQQYVVTNLNNDALQSFPTLAAATEFMGQIGDFALLDRSLLESGQRYQVWLRAELDIEALPAPLRPVAYLSAQWRLSSEWATWPL
jgi:hypothetical protein